MGMYASDSLANRIKNLRIENNLTQKQLAEQLYVTRQAVTFWESGHRIPDIETLSRMAEVFNVQIHDLIDAMTGPNDVPNIILVDDENEVRRSYLKMPKAELPGIKVFGFHSAGDALDFARVNRVSVAFLDIRLSNCSGLDLARLLKKEDAKTNLVFLTQHTEYYGEAWEMYASGYLLKPLTPEKIRDTVNNLRYPVRGLPAFPAR